MESIRKRIMEMFGYFMLIVVWIAITIPMFVFCFGYAISWLWREIEFEDGMDVVKAIVITPAIGIAGGFAGIREIWFKALPTVIKANDSI